MRGQDSNKHQCSLETPDQNTEFPQSALVVWLSVVVFVSVGAGLGLGGSAGVATAVVAIWIGCFISRALIR